jgi:hypothetical protein
MMLQGERLMVFCNRWCAFVQSVDNLSRCL